MSRHVLHEDPTSRNSYKVKLTASLVNTPLSLKAYSVLRGETRTSSFLKNVNPMGKIPVLEVGSGPSTVFLPESNAACFYLADIAHSPLIPSDPLERADMLHWMFFEQYAHLPNISTLRYWIKFVGEENLTDEQRALMPDKRKKGEEALDVMEGHLQAGSPGNASYGLPRKWFVGQGEGSLSLADLVLFAYTEVAAEAGFALGTGKWKRIEEWCVMMREVSEGGFYSHHS